MGFQIHVIRVMLRSESFLASRPVIRESAAPHVRSASLISAGSVSDYYPNQGAQVH